MIIDHPVVKKVNTKTTTFLNIEIFILYSLYIHIPHWSNE